MVLNSLMLNTARFSEVVTGSRGTWSPCAPDDANECSFVKWESPSSYRSNLAFPKLAVKFFLGDFLDEVQTKVKNVCNVEDVCAAERGYVEKVA